MRAAECSCSFITRYDTRMSPLLVMPALPRTADVAREALPALPALCELLRLADAGVPESGWRSGLLGDLGAGPRQFPDAVIAASALGIAPASSVCLVSPVHAVAGMHRVHLHAAGILPLAAGERAALAEGFAAQFGPELKLHDAGNQWVLEAGCAMAADDTDPLDWAGAPLERRPASSPEQRLLRRLGTEIEMWLASLPANLRRSPGNLPVNLFWMWGGGVMPARGELPRLPDVKIHGAVDDAWLAGCAALAGGSVTPLPHAWPREGGTGRVMVLPAATDASQLLALEAAWFLPALEYLRADRLETLGLRLGRRLYRVRFSPIRRLLRRSRPWWLAVDA
jgi:hypothetical protein